MSLLAVVVDVVVGVFVACLVVAVNASSTSPVLMVGCKWWADIGHAGGE